MSVPGRDDFDVFVAARSPGLLRTAFLLTGDEHLAQDLLQTALVKTWKAWSRIERVESAEAYVRRVLVTTATSWWRRRSSGEKPTGVLPTTAVPGRFDGVDARLALVAALRRLGRSQRAVVVLRYYEDMTEAQVADILSTSVGNVKSQASRGLAALRRDVALHDWAPPGNRPIPASSDQNGFLTTLFGGNDAQRS